MFADSPVYCTQLSSQHTNLHDCTNKIQRLLMKIQYVRVCVHNFNVTPCIPSDRAPPIIGVQSCVHAKPALNMVEESGFKQVSK